MNYKDEKIIQIALYAFIMHKGNKQIQNHKNKIKINYYII